MERLAQREVHTVLDLLHLYPRRIHDRTAVTPIDQLEIGTETTVFGSVVKVSSRFTKARKKMVVATVEGGDARLEVTFFNQPWREQQLGEGTEVAMFGKVETFAGRRRMTNPVVDVIGGAGEQRTGRIVAVYPQSAKADLSSWEIAPAVARALEFAGEVYDPLDDAIRGPLRLEDRTTAFRDVHRPDSAEAHRRAERRLRFDEFLVAQVGLVARKRALAAAEIGIRHAVDGPLVGEFLARLPFAITPDQSRAIDEIRADLARPAPMHRLLQGDVGSGKTAVALYAALLAIAHGHQAAIVAPTELLAEQHFRNVVAL
ncbi:MAG: DEAD/DEAH box helicase, partial [Gemmatimonadota bacterium]